MTGATMLVWQLSLIPLAAMAFYVGEFTLLFTAWRGRAALPESRRATRRASWRAPTVFSNRWPPLLSCCCARAHADETPKPEPRTGDTWVDAQTSTAPSAARTTLRAEFKGGRLSRGHDWCSAPLVPGGAWSAETESTRSITLNRYRDEGREEIIGGGTVDPIDELESQAAK